MFDSAHSNADPAGGAGHDGDLADHRRNRTLEIEISLPVGGQVNTATGLHLESLRYSFNTAVCSGMTHERSRV